MIIGYARVSKKEQAENSNAFDNQKARLREYGVNEIIEDVQARTRNDRQGFLKLKSMIMKGLVSEVVVTRLSRLSGDRRLLVEFEELQVKHNLKITFLDEPMDLSTSSGRLQYGILSVLSCHYILELTEKTRAGQKAIRTRGGANPKIPFGYLRVEEKYRLDLIQQGIADDIVNFYLEERSLNKTSSLLYDKYQFKFTGGGIKLWLINPVLCGHTPYKVENRILYNTHPDQRLLTDEKQQEIKNIIEYNRRHWGGNNTNHNSDKWVNPFSGLIFCPVCDRPATIRKREWDGKGKHNLIRAAYCRTRAGKVPGETCSNKKTCNLEDVEKAVVAALTQKAKEIADLIAKPQGLQPTEPPEILELRSQINQLKLISNPNPVILNTIDQLEKELRDKRSLLDRGIVNQEQLKKDLVEVFQDPVLWDTVLKQELTPQELQSTYFKFVKKILFKDGIVTSVKLNM